MSMYAEIHGHRVITGRITIPLWGCWHADVRVDDYVDEVQMGTLRVGALALVCSVVRSANVAGARSQRLVGGAGGWRKDVSSRQYQHDAGVMISLVLRETASEVGETVVIGEDRSIGPGYTRTAGPAARVLRDLVGDNGWYLREDGVTVIGTRPGGAVPGAYTAIGYDGAAGVVTIGADDVSALMPGRTISTAVIGTRLICGVTHLLDKGTLRSDCMIGDGDRIKEGLLGLIREESRPNTLYLAQWEYQVASSAWGSVDVEPGPEALAAGLPPLAGVKCIASIIGGTSRVPVGTTVLVGFRNGNPIQPYVAHVDGTQMTEIALDAETSITLGQGLIQKPFAVAGDLAGPYPIVTTQTLTSGK